MQQSYNIPPHFPLDARVWVFVGDRTLSTLEVSQMIQALKDFFKTWQTHGKPLDAYGFVLHEAALVIVANEAEVQASGCSMDKINHFVKNAGMQLNVNFFDRMNVLTPNANGTWEHVKFNMENMTTDIHSNITVLKDLSSRILE